MCEFVVNSFPFEIILMRTAARRAGEPFVQQFLDKHSRAVLVSPSPLRLISSSGHANAFPLFPAGRRLCLRRLPATPCFSIGPRQHDRKFPGRTPPLFAPPSPLRLIPPPRHANTARILPGGRRLCWRPPPRCALFLRLATPTPSDFSRAHAPLLAPPSPLRLIPPLGHANTGRLFPGARHLCWRRPPRCALFLRLATPTPSGFP